MQDISVPSSESRSVLESMRRSVHDNIFRGELGSVLGVFLGASWEVSLKPVVKQAGNVTFSAIGSVFESVLWSAVESVLRAGLEAYSQAGWEGAIKCNWERPEFGFTLVQYTMMYSITHIQLHVYHRNLVNLLVHTASYCHP
jgi:hypothetical protein